MSAPEMSSRRQSRPPLSRKRDARRCEWVVCSNWMWICLCYEMKARRVTSRSKWRCERKSSSYCRSRRRL